MSSERYLFFFFPWAARAAKICRFGVPQALVGYQAQAERVSPPPLWLTLTTLGDACRFWGLTTRASRLEGQ